MSAMEAWRDEAASELFEAIVRLETADEASAFFRDLCTLGELHDLAQRWAVVRLLDAGMHYAEISTRTGASTATIRATTSVWRRSPTLAPSRSTMWIQRAPAAANRRATSSGSDP